MLETFEITEDGDIKISDHVISVIATVAALSVDGVSKMSGTIAEDLQERFKLRQDSGKGVRVEFKEGSVDIILHIYVEYGHSIVDVAEEVQVNVKESVKSMTDMEIGAVDIIIEGVTLDRELKSIPQANR